MTADPQALVALKPCEPAAWLYTRPNGTYPRLPEHSLVTTRRWAENDPSRSEGWTETPLYTRTPPARSANAEVLARLEVTQGDVDALRYVLNHSDSTSRVRTIMTTFNNDFVTIEARLERLYSALRQRLAAEAAAQARVDAVLRDAIDNAGDESELRMAEAIRHEVLAALRKPDATDGGEA